MFRRLDATPSYDRHYKIVLNFHQRTGSHVGVSDVSARDVVPIAVVTAGYCWTRVLKVTFGKSFGQSLTGDMPLLVTDEGLSCVVRRSCLAAFTKVVQFVADHL